MSCIICLARQVPSAHNMYLYCVLFGNFDLIVMYPSISAVYAAKSIKRVALGAKKKSFNKLRA